MFTATKYLSLLALISSPLHGQSGERRGFDPALTSAALALAIGTGGASSEWFQGLYDHGRAPADPRADLGGLSVNLAFQRHVEPRLALGAEVGLFVIGPGELRGLDYGPLTCFGSGCAGSPTDDVGIHVGGVGALRLLTLGRIVFRVEGGAGAIFFNLNAAGPAEAKNHSIEDVEGTPYYESKPGPEPYAVGRFAPAIVLLGEGGTALTLNPFVSVLRTFGTTSTQSVTFGASLGILIGRRRG